MFCFRDSYFRRYCFFKFRSERRQHLTGDKSQPLPGIIKFNSIFPLQEESMSMKEEKRDDVTILMLKGKLMGGAETSAVHNRIKELVEAGEKKIIMDLGKVKWMNSSGLGALMASLTTVKNSGGELKLTSVAEKVESLLMITQLIKIFDTKRTIEDAMESF